MAEKQYGLGDIKVLLPIQYLWIKSVDIIEHVNQHGCMTVCMVVPSEVEEMDVLRLENAEISLVNLDNNCLFAGVCAYTALTTAAQYKELIIHAKTSSILIDQEYKTQTFQSETKMLSGIILACLQGYNILFSVESDIVISQVLSQSDETPWEFIRRIANQNGFQVFVDSKSTKANISIGFTSFGNSNQIDFVSHAEVKDISASLMLQMNTSNNISAFELSEKIGYVFNPFIGVGYTMKTQYPQEVITHSHITSTGNVLQNQITLQTPIGTKTSFPQIARSAQLSTVLKGIVKSVKGNDVVATFSGDGEFAGTRLIPYESAVSNYFYCMPDEGDTVFAYYQNDGSIICLGSKHINTSPDFDIPQNKMLTANDHMIKASTGQLEFVLKRDKINNNDENKTKIFFSADNGIEVKSETDLQVLAPTGMIEIVCTPEDKNWSDSFALLNDKVKALEDAGENNYLSNGGGVLPTYSFLEKWMAGELNKLNTYIKVSVEAVDVVSLVQRLIGIFSPQTQTAQDPLSPPYEDGIISLTGTKAFILQVGNSVIIMQDNTLGMHADTVYMVGFDRKNYEQVKLEQETLRDKILNVIEAGALVVSLVTPPPISTVAGGVAVGTALMRGDLVSAGINATAMIPMGATVAIGAKITSTVARGGATVVKIVSGAAKTIRFLKKVNDVAGNINMVLGVYDVVNAIGENGLTPATVLDAMTLLLNLAQNKIETRNNTGTSSSSDSGSDGPNRADGSTNRPDPVALSDGNAPPQGDGGKPENAPSGADPINFVTGSFKSEYIDFVIDDICGDFKLTRRYESVYTNPQQLLGAKWLLNIGMRIFFEGNIATILKEDLSVESFEKEGDTWVNQKTGDCAFALRQSNNEYVLLDNKTQRSYFFSNSGRLLSITDMYGNTAELFYCGDTLERFVLANGQFLEFEYAFGKISGICDVLKRKVSYTYDGEYLTKVTYQNGGSIQYEYSAKGYITSIKDQNGRRYIYNSYDDKGRVIKQTTADDQEWIILYDDDNRTNTVLFPETNAKTIYRYNKNQQVTCIEYTDGTTSEYRYDNYDNRIWEKDRNGNVTKYTYNSQGKLLETHAPSGLISYCEYDEKGNLIKGYNSLGAQTCYEYDSKNRLVVKRMLLTGSNWSITRYQYDDLGRLVAFCDQLGHTTYFTYEGKNRNPITKTMPGGSVFEYTYDAAGRCMSISNELGVTEYGYTSLNYRAIITDSLGGTTKYNFDKVGNLLSHIRPNHYDVKTGDGISMRFEYDAMDRRISTISPDGSVLGVRYDSQSNIIKEINPNTYDIFTKDGQGICYGYDVDNRRVRIIYPDGGVERIKYDANGNIIKKIQPAQYDANVDDGPGYCYDYDESNRLVQITRPDGIVERRYVYDLLGNIIKEIDANGFLSGSDDVARIGTLYCYNLVGWITSKREPIINKEGTVFYRLTEYLYDDFGNVIHERRYQDMQTIDSSCGPIHTISFTYDADSRVIQVSDCTGAVVEYKYNGLNQRVYEKRKLSDSVSQIFRYQYDAAGRMSESTRSTDQPDGSPSMAVTKYTYDKTGNITRIQLPIGAEIQRTYDIADRLISETHKDKSSGIQNRTEFSYDKAGNLITITDTQGRKTLIEYDLLNREIRRTEKDGGVQRRIYDPNGRLAKLVRPNQYDPAVDDGAGYQYTYDLQGRVITVLAPNGTVLQTNTYAPDGQLLQQLDGVGGGASFSYDLAGNRLRIETKGGASQDFEYDAAGNIIGIVDGNHNRTGYQLDKWGRITQVLKADGSIEFYTYDYAGNMTSSTDGEGHTTQYEYNRAGLMSKLIDPMGEAEAYAYDGMGRMVRKADRNGNITEYGYTFYDAPLYRRNQATGLEEVYAYTPEGLLRAAIGGGMRYSYKYDQMGRLLRKSASGRALLSHTYDKNGNRISQTDVTGRTIEYVYDDLDLLVEVYENGSKLSTYEHNPDGTVKSLQNGPLRTLYSYDIDKNITGLVVSSSGQLLVENYYSYDGNGNRLSKQQLGGDTKYTFDALNQLTKVQYPSLTEELFYDKSGNRIRREVDGVEELYHYDPRNRLTQLNRSGVVTPFRYDNAGNLLADDKALYSYDAFNRTTKVETIDGNVHVNRYDAECLRHELEENGRLVQFIFNSSSEVVAEQDENKWMLYIRASSLLASSTDHARTYYHYASDEMGSTTHIVDRDGAVQNRYAYDAWGNVTEQTENVPNRFKFNGQQLDPITQQYYLRARFYNPVIARFTQEDTYRGDGLNLYAYCANNPVYYADPSGNEKSSPWGTDDKGRTTYKDANGNTYKQDANGSWHDSSGQYCPDPTLANQPTSPTANQPNAKPSNKEIGRRGEQAAKDMLKANGWTILTEIRNSSDNGIDIIARGPDGRLGFFEVKATDGGRIGDLSGRQSDMDAFIRNVLREASQQDGRYRGIDETTRQAASDILAEYRSNPESVTGSVIGVDISTGEVYISRWNR